MLLTEYKIQNNKPIIYSYGRNKDGSKYCNKITDFKPYFYVLKGQESIYRNDNRVVDIVDNDYKEIKGKEVVKIVVNNPFDIRELSYMVSESFEADIDLNTRYSIDTIGEIEKEPIATCFIDIETDHDKTFPTPRKAAFPITAITCYNTLLKKMITFCWQENSSTDKIWREYCYSNNIVIPDQHKNNFTIEHRHLEKEDIYYTDTTMFFDNEREMLNNFLSYIEDTDPDVFSAWNLDGFDMPYIIQRLHNIALDYNRLSPMRIVTKQPDRMNKDLDDITIKGRVCLDLLTTYKILNFKGLDSYKLDNVAEKELGVKKVEYEGTLANLWRTDFEKFVEYNKMDVELLVRLDHKKKIVNIFDEIRRMSKCTYSDMFKPKKYESTKVTDAFILSYCKQKDIVLPNKGFHSKEKFAGAVVLTPIKGLHEYLTVFDFQGLYMKIAQSLNCSPETIMHEYSDDYVYCNIPYLDAVKMENEISVKTHRKLLNDEFSKFFEDNWNIQEQKFNCNVSDKFLPFLSYKKVYYRQDEIGLLPGLIDHLFGERNIMKKTRDKYEYGTEEYEFYERKQYGFKVIMNSIYGCIGYSGFRLYTPEIAASITFIGRNAILWSKRIVEDMEMLK